MRLSKKLQIPLFLGVSILSFGSSACWVPAQTGERMLRDINHLQEEMRNANRTLEKQTATHEERGIEIAEKIKEVSLTLDKLNKAARMTDADLGIKIERLIQEAQALRGSFEIVEHRTQEIEKHFGEENSLVKRLENIEQRLDDPVIRVSHEVPKPHKTITKKLPPPSKKLTKNVENKKYTGTSTPKTKTKTKTKTTITKDSLLKEARTLQKSGKHQAATLTYKKLIRKYPSKQGYTDEAYFQLGELHFTKKSYRLALQQYIKVVDQFANGKRVDDAYFRIGTCSVEIGNLQDAAIFFEEIVNNHKKSPLIKDARKKLKEVKAKLVKEKKNKKKA
ncbi:MAG: tetratricopeptide repeat protein [Myxococcota bacterium]|nr:tetratricopeptide repeat protein [Myxococcota bacterium]